jgi:NAD(P)-binding Rossmann-like domain
MSLFPRRKKCRRRGPLPSDEPALANSFATSASITITVPRTSVASDISGWVRFSGARCNLFRLDKIRNKGNLVIAYIIESNKSTVRRRDGGKLGFRSHRQASPLHAIVHFTKINRRFRPFGDIGAGGGGLASAMLLAGAGYRVKVLEGRDRESGRTSTIGGEGFGSTWGQKFFLFPRVPGSICPAVGRNLHDEV